MNRDEQLKRIVARQEPWDIAIIGGGATGMGVAVDAAARGYAVCLLEQHDFGKGTSSRSTKLIHGGVRYLQQGNIALVMEALKERGILRQNAPHLVHDLPFVVPNYAWWETPFYGMGMRVYDLLAGKYGFGKSRLLSTAEVLAHIPTLQQEGLRGGVLYYDGQFDDARLLIDLALTAHGLGAALLNYAPVTELAHDGEGYVNGLAFTDAETGAAHRLRARCVVNAAGPFCDAVRRLDDPAAAPMIAPSQGVHVVLERSFLPGDAAIMVPHTSDGRVLFAIPWHGHALLGTTDTPIAAPTLEPVAQAAEIDFILATAAHYLAKPPTRADILSVFTGIRPLVKAAADTTAALSREHTIHVARSGLLTIAGGKWTTYRKMAADTVDHAITLGRLDERPCVTRELRIHGSVPRESCSPPSESPRSAPTPTPAPAPALNLNLNPHLHPHPNAPLPDSLAHLHIYGTAAAAILSLIAETPSLATQLHPALPMIAAQVVHAARHEMARTVEDVLARRTRALFLNARAAHAMAPQVAALLAAELGRDQAWQQSQHAEFAALAGHYLPGRPK